MKQIMDFASLPLELLPPFGEEDLEMRGRRTFVRPAAQGSRPLPGRGFRPAPRPVRPPRPIRRRPHVRPHYPIFANPVDPVVPDTERVRWLQDCLNQSLGLRLPLTGVIGPATRSALRTFQQQQGLRMSGILGPDTEEALRAACNGPAPQDQEMELGPLTATLNWQTNPGNPTAPFLFTRDQTRDVDGGGVYIAVDTHKGDQILKVGKTWSFKANPFGDKRYRAMARSRPGLRFYVATYRGSRGRAGGGGVLEMIEKAVARLLYRAGEALPEDKSAFVATPVLGRVKIRNILPPPLQALIPVAYLASGMDRKGRSIPPRTRKSPLPATPGLLSLTPSTFPAWEVTAQRD